MIQDLKIGVRMLLKRPGFTLIVVLTLGIGIGSTAAVFSLIQGVLLTPPPYNEPDRMVLVSPTRTDGNNEMRAPDWAAAHWLEWRETVATLESLAGYRWSFNFLISAEGSESLEGLAVSQDYFQVAGLTPAIGRAFEASDTAPGAPPVIILGHDLWRRSFDSDPEIVGKTLRLSRRETPPTIIGVMPPAVRFLPSPATAQEPNYNVDAVVDFWAPASPSPESARRRGWNVVARLSDEATVSEAQAELEVLVKRQTDADPELGGAMARVESLTTVLNQDGRGILLPLLGAAGLVLLIACGNAAALLLIRGLQRQREYGVRGAMGAGRAALVRQVSVESLLMAGLGGAAGVALAVAIVKIFKAIGTHAIPRLDAVTTGWPVLAFGLCSALLAALLAGLYPALRVARLSVVDSLQSAGTKSSVGRAERRLLASVTMAQAALTLALLIGAGLLIRTMGNLTRVESGYNAAHVLTMSVTAVDGGLAGFPRQGPRERRGDSRCGARGLRLGCAPDRQQLARQRGDRGAARRHGPEWAAVPLGGDTGDPPAFGDAGLLRPARPEVRVRAGFPRLGR